MKEINRIKAVLIEQNKTGKWLADNLGKDAVDFLIKTAQKVKQRQVYNLVF